MKCWICGKDADSREHIPKASDVRLFFGEVSADNPLYLHNNTHKNVLIRSAKSDKLKTKNKVICRRCNDTDTSSFDNAWTELLKYLHGNWEKTKTDKKINLKKIFPSTSKKSAINFHLYFVKLFGCLIVDNNLPIDIDQFSYCLRQKKIHDTVYLAFSCWNLSDGAKYLGPSQIETKNYNGSIEMAIWIYSIGELDVEIVWFKNPPQRNVPKAWSPNDKGSIIKFRKK